MDRAIGLGDTVEQRFESLGVRQVDLMKAAGRRENSCEVRRERFLVDQCQSVAVSEQVVDHSSTDTARGSRDEDVHCSV